MSDKTATQKAYAKAKKNDNLGSDQMDYIKFKGEGERTLKFLDDDIYEGENWRTGDPEWKAWYKFEEIREDKENREVQYETTLRKRDPETKEMTETMANFPQQMNDFDYDDKLVAWYQKIEGTPRGFIKIQPAGETEDDDEEIPVVEE